MASRQESMMQLSCQSITHSSSIGIDRQDSHIILYHFDAIGQNHYLFPILKIVETVVIMEIRLNMVMRIVGIDILNNPPCSGSPSYRRRRIPELLFTFNSSMALQPSMFCDKRQTAKLPSLFLSSDLEWVHQLVFPKTDIER